MKQVLRLERLHPTLQLSLLALSGAVITLTLIGLLHGMWWLLLPTAPMRPLITITTAVMLLLISVLLPRLLEPFLEDVPTPPGDRGEA